MIGRPLTPGKKQALLVRLHDMVRELRREQNQQMNTAPAGSRINSPKGPTSRKEELGNVTLHSAGDRP